MNDESYYEKVKNWNLRVDYKKDIETISLLTNYCLSKLNSTDLYFIGTGLGADIDSIVKSLKLKSIIGIEPLTNFYDSALSKYENIGAKLLNCSLGELSQKSTELSGIFIFSHSINHIPEEELKQFQKILKKSYIIIINPNPEFPKRFWWTDDTILDYFSGNDIANLLNCESIFDFFYNLVDIKGKKIFVRNAVLLKTKDF
jgi:hypothetical protein